MRAVQRALNLLGCFSKGRPRVTLSEAARLTGLPLSTVSRLLSTLEGAGFLRRPPGGGYACGTRLMQIGLSALQSVSTYEIAEAHLQRLTQETGESSYLGIPSDEAHIIYVRHSVSPKSIRYSTWLGRMVPIKDTAIGAAIQGRVGEGGFAATRVTLEPDATAIAAPIRNSDGVIEAAVNLVGPSYRISEDDLQRHGRAVVATAAAIARDIVSFADRS